MKFISHYVVLFVTLCCLLMMGISAGAATHLEERYIKTGCAACHLGFDFKYGGGVQRCLLCHGPDNKSMIGITVPGVSPKNVVPDLGKNYSHQLKTSIGKHSPREILPETDQSMPRHADCNDCHKPHTSSYSSPFAGIAGKKIGNITTQITKEYELCYLCHSDSANLPVKSTNKRVEFSINNPSFHPIEGEGKNQAVISLIRPYREKKSSPSDVSILKCADCHSSDDPTR